MNDRLKKFWSQLAGPQATALENGINGLWIVVATVAFVVSLFLRDIQWSWYQWLIAVFLLVDIAGGISVNASNSAKRWWHRPSQTKVDHLKFVSLHLVHLLIPAFFFAEFTYLQAVAAFVFLVLSSLCILFVPEYVQRMVAFILYAVALVLILYVFDSPLGLEWFLPFFYLKLFLAHLVKENVAGMEAEGRRE